LASALLLEGGVAHRFTLRPMNLSTRNGPAAHGAEQARAALCEALGADPGRLTSMAQVHGDRIGVVDETNVGTRLPGVDALIVPSSLRRSAASSLPPVLALSADCPIVLVFDPEAGVLGLAHAGWRGTVAGIAENLVRTMVRDFGGQPGKMLAAISPSAGPCCYEVGQDVVDAAARRLPNHGTLFHRRDGKSHFDLWAANVAQLTDAGLAVGRMDLAARCTICDQACFSYRRDGRTTGHAGLIAVIGM